MENQQNKSGIGFCIRKIIHWHGGIGNGKWQTVRQKKKRGKKPGRKEKTEAIPKGHEKGTREKGGATFTTVDPEKVAKAIGMDDTM